MNEDDSALEEIEIWSRCLISKGKASNEYHKQYQRDLRTIKRLGLNCTVKEWREKNEQ